MSFGIAFAFPAYDNPPNVGPFTQSGPTLDLLFTGLPAVNNTFVGQSLSLDFLTQQYQLPAQYSVWVAGQGLTSKTFSQIVTFSRATTGTYTDSAGVLQTAAINAPRFDYNPTTLAPLGFLVEEARTNSIRNNTMVGAVAGTPGTLPTNWTIGGVTTGLTTSVVGTGTENGVTYIDIRFNGVAVGALNPNILFDTASAIAASNGQAWSWSFYTSLVGGSLANVTNIIAVQAMYNSTPSLIGTLPGSAITPTNAALITQRQVFRATLNQAATAFVRPQLQFSVANGATVDITLRIGLPQLELGAFATSVIPTTTGTVTRAADLAAINTLSPWFNSAQGTLFAQFEASANTYTAYVDISNGVTAQNSIHIDNDTGLMRAVYYSGSAPVATLSLGAIGTVGTVNKVATSYAANDFKANRNGGSVVSDPAGALPVGLTQMNIGADPSGTAVNVINGHIQRITYYPRSMANYELQALTV